MKREGFNADWIFYSAEKPDEKKNVHLPHDAMLFEERLPRLKNGALFGYYPGGDYYYEKKIFGKQEFIGKSVILEFGGIYMDSHIYLNGEEIGGHVYGYSHFFVDLSDKLKAGEDNFIRVFVHNSQTPNGRWYTGSGIYRPVSLLIGEKSHIDIDGVKIVTKSYSPAVLDVSVRTINGEGKRILTEILWQGNVVASGEGAHCEINVPDAKLWDAEHPNLYTARISLYDGDRLLDVDEQHIGIRQLEWNAKRGLLVNGKQIKLRGGCVHSGNGPLGAMSFKEAEYRRIRKLKESGYNAVRGAHDPRCREFLDACDEIGMYVLEEAFDVWYRNTGNYGYVFYFMEEWRNDLTLMVEKCYNHPSVIMYSIGNEIMEAGTEEGAAIGGEMVALCHKLDDSRPVTLGMNLMLSVLNDKGMGVSFGETAEFHKDDVVDPKSQDEDVKMGGSVFVNKLVGFMMSGPGKVVIDWMTNPKATDKPTKLIYEKLDICGYNYGLSSYKKHLEKYPDRLILGTETYPTGIFDSWQLVKSDPRILGDFCWTAWDYLGEAGVGVIDYDKNTGIYSKPYPCISAGCGTHDLTGFADPYAYYEAVVWEEYKKPYIIARDPKHAGHKMIPGMYRFTDAIHSWSFEGYEGVKTTVIVYSIGESVELKLNGRSLGKKKLKKCEATFYTKYESGALEAVSYDGNGREIARDVIRSASGNTQITVEIEKPVIEAGCEDLCYLNVSLTDENGIVKPLEKKINVSVEGAGTLLAVGSGNPNTDEDYTGNGFTTYNGRVQAIVRSGKSAGTINVHFSCVGFESKVVQIMAK